MPIGTRRRVSGRLMKSGRGLIVELDDGGVYALDGCEEAEDLIGFRVTVEGVRSGFDRLEVEWIGPAVVTKE